MLFISAADRDFAKSISAIVYCNPFLPERFEFERQALGEEYHSVKRILSKEHEFDIHHPNFERATKRARAVLQRCLENRASVLAKECTPKATPPAKQGDDFALHEDLILFVLYNQYREDFDALIFNVNVNVNANTHAKSAGRIGFFDRFASSYMEYFPKRVSPADLAHLFALCFQLRRAFYHIYHFIIGTSLPAARLRAAVWQSIFTHDMRRYRRALFNRLGDLTCLINGPSGTGKELVARAIGFSRYIPFDAASGRFAEDFSRNFLSLNLSALTPTLIESELFGHKRGSFTGALADRAGWLEVCSPYGTVFLDEIGELAPELQVKLLRVLQTRVFQRIGESKERAFEGKIIAATNRDLALQMRQGSFREDLYYRLCSDRIVTPSLREQLNDSPAELAILVNHLAVRLIGETEAPSLVSEALHWIETNLPRDYPWPGNVRELEQCVRNILVRNAYLTPQTARDTSELGQHEWLAQAVRHGTLKAEELLVHYTSLIYAETGSYQETSRRLDLDHRTIKNRVHADLVIRYRGES